MKVTKLQIFIISLILRVVLLAHSNPIGKSLEGDQLRRRHSIQQRYTIISFAHRWQDSWGWGQRGLPAWTWLLHSARNAQRRWSKWWFRRAVQRDSLTPQYYWAKSTAGNEICADWLTNGLTLANGLQVCVTFVTKQNSPDSGDVPKVQREYSAAREIQFWGKHLSPQIIIIFSWLVLEIPCLESQLFNFLHSLCWFWTYPAPVPAWAGLEMQAVRWESAHCPREETDSGNENTGVSGGRQQKNTGECATERGHLQQSQRHVWVWPKMAECAERAAQQPAAPTTLLCRTEDGGRGRCCTRAWYHHICMLKCTSERKGGVETT